MMEKLFSLFLFLSFSVMPMDTGKTVKCRILSSKNHDEHLFYVCHNDSLEHIGTAFKYMGKNYVYLKHSHYQKLFHRMMKRTFGYYEIKK